MIFKDSDIQSSYLDISGDIYFAGKNDNELFGEYNLTRSDTFNKIDTVYSKIKWKQVVSSNTHILYLTQKNIIRGFGSNDYNESIDVSNMNILNVYAGDNYSIILDHSNNVYGIGKNDKKQLGIDLSDTILEYTKIDVSNIQHVVCGNNHTFFIDSENNVYSCGDNSYNQCFVKNNGTNIASLQKIELEFNVKKIVCGDDYTIMNDQSGNVYVNGYNSSGQLGGYIN